MPIHLCHNLWSCGSSRLHSALVEIITCIVNWQYHAVNSFPIQKYIFHPPVQCSIPFKKQVCILAALWLRENTTNKAQDGNVCGAVSKDERRRCVATQTPRMLSPEHQNTRAQAFYPECRKTKPAARMYFVICDDSMRIVSLMSANVYASLRVSFVSNVTFWKCWLVWCYERRGRRLKTDFLCTHLIWSCAVQINMTDVFFFHIFVCVYCTGSLTVLQSVRP